jgi:hypothetical protein
MQSDSEKKRLYDSDIIYAMREKSLVSRYITFIYVLMSFIATYLTLKHKADNDALPISVMTFI